VDEPSVGFGASDGLEVVEEFRMVSVTREGVDNFRIFQPRVFSAQ